MKHSPHYYIISLGLVLSSPAIAQQRLSLQDCLRQAYDNNLALRSNRIAVERAKDLQATAFDIEKTSVSLSQDPTSGGSPDNALSISQTFEFPTIYGARRSQLKAETSLEKSRLEVTQNELRHNVSAAYYSLLYAMERKRILEKQTAIYARFLQLANAKLKAGETGRLEWMNAERLSRDNEIALSNATTDVHIASIALQRWICSDTYILPLEDSLTIIEYTPSATFNANATPIGQALEQQRKVSEKNLKVAKQGYLPDISLSASTQMVLRGFNPYNVDRSRYDKGNFMGFEVGLSVPIFFGGQRAKVKAAKHDVAIAETKIAEQMQTLDKQYRTAYEEYKKATTSLQYYQTQGAAQANEIERISLKAYENGEIGYVEYVQNLQTALDIHNDYAMAINNYNQAVITLNYIKGENK